MAQAQPDGGSQDALEVERWRIYVEVAREEYKLEEDRWRSAQDKAKTVFAVAAVVATLMFGRLDWAATRTAGGWERWPWLAMLYVGSGLLAAALVITAMVFAPKSAFRMEPSHTAKEKLWRAPPDQAQHYLAENYASTAQKNATVIDRELGRVRWATRLVAASLIIALLQLVLALSVPRA